MISEDRPVLNAPRFICFKKSQEDERFTWLFSNNGESHSQMREFAKEKNPSATYFFGGFYSFADANACKSIKQRRLEEKYHDRNMTEQEEDDYANYYQTIWKSLTVFGISDSLGLTPESFDIAVIQLQIENPSIFIKVIEDFNDYHNA